jgi:hypothetical protein
MNRKLLPLLAALLSLGAANAFAGSTHPCAETARKVAVQLTQLVSDDPDLGDKQDRVFVEPRVDTLPPVRNPAGGRMRLQPLEVWAARQKATYRIRVYFLRDDRRECLPVNLEVITWSTF